MIVVLDADSGWTWVDGSDSTFTSWNEGEPNFGNADSEYCAYISNKDGHWDDNRCQDQQHQIICKIKKGGRENPSFSTS